MLICVKFHLLKPRIDYNKTIKSYYYEIQLLKSQNILHYRINMELLLQCLFIGYPLGEIVWRQARRIPFFPQLNKKIFILLNFANNTVRNQTRRGL
jgi:hypothetical protein